MSTESNQPNVTVGQPDLFESKSVVVAQNEALGAIFGGDLDAASAALERLQRDFPGDTMIQPLSTMLGYALDEASCATCPEAIAAYAERLRREVEPVTRRILDAQAQTWIRQRYAQLAERAQGLSFDPQWPHADAGWLFNMAGQDKRALARLQEIAEWYRSVDIAHALLEASMRRHGISGAWKFFCEFAWRRPDEARAWAEADGRKTLVPFNLVVEFDAWASEDLGFDWFPAWTSTQFPVLAHDWRPGAKTRTNRVPVSFAESAMYAMADLLKARRDGESDMHARQAVHAIEPKLLQAVLATKRQTPA